MSPQPENPPQPGVAVAGPESCEFTLEERRTLLKVAHQSIESAFENHEIPSDPPSSHLAEPRGAFTTIYFQGQLRGCVGRSPRCTALSLKQRGLRPSKTRASGP